MLAANAPTTRRKLLWLTRNLPPLVGGMERFNERVLAELASDFEIVVCGPAGSASALPFASTVVEIPVKPLPRFLLRMSFEALRAARRFQPDIVIAGSGLTAPFAWMAGRRTGAKALVFLYGLDLMVAHRVYRSLWLRAIRACDGAIAISRHTHDLAIRTGVLPQRLRIVNPGIDFPPETAPGNGAFRQRHGLGDAPLLLSVGRLTRRKGLAEFVCKALPLIVEQHPETVLIVIGGEPVDALAGNRDGGSAAIMQAASRVGLESHVRMIGRVSDQELAEAYIDGNVYVFPVIDIPDDVEGFGLVALDAAAHAMPTVAFSVGGVPDAVLEGVSGTLLRPGDYAGFALAVQRYLRLPWGASQRDACLRHAGSCSWREVGARMRRAVSELSRGLGTPDAR